MIVDKFYCCSLKTGAIFVSVYFLSIGGFRFGAALELIRDINNGDFDDFFVKHDIEKNQAMAALVVVLIFSIFLVLVAFFLFSEARNKNPDSFLPVLIIIPLDLAAGWIFTMIVLSGWISSTVAFPGWISAMVILLFIFMAISSVLGCYYWVCIFSLWQQLKEESGAAKENIEIPAQETPV